ncbi:MAG: hypothetical protein L6R38_004433 [Xanthoria sp. 2 TBL-2021]|nr:MAG: hypothetical protein L6R38_004433 [Xanthoria sp. 2 TBL-2021]
MVHYIRFLQPPRVTRLNKDGIDALLSTLLTITTDLGDAFYPGDSCVHSAIFNGTTMRSLDMAHWKPGMRVLKIEAKVPLDFLPFRARFLFTCNESFEIDALQTERLPNIISAWTEEFTHLDDLDTDMTVRRFRVQAGRVLEICEENGDSMARHIWDGGVVLAAWLMDWAELEQHRDIPFTVLELGTGCGTVGLAFGIRSDCRLLLTDVDDDALTYARHNARRSRDTFNSVWECSALDWSEPDRLKLDRPLDFIIVSECIYNPDSIPDLVRTMSSLVRRSNGMKDGSPQPQIIVSTKVRHSSEAAFFDLMKESGFDQNQHVSIPIHDQYRESVGQDLEVVHIFVFEKQNEVLSSRDNADYDEMDETDDEQPALALE